MIFKAFLQRSIPSLFHHTRWNLHTVNINFLEYFERRLDDGAYVIRPFILQYEDHNTSEDFLPLLDHLHQWCKWSVPRYGMLRKWNSGDSWNSHEGLPGKDFRSRRK